MEIPGEALCKMGFWWPKFCAAPEFGEFIEMFEQLSVRQLLIV